MNESPAPETPPHGTEMLRGPHDESDLSACPECGGWRPAQAEFCETCGVGAADGATLVIDVFADREYFDTIDGAGLVFPDGRRVRTLRFEGDVVNIGRRRSGDVVRVDVDLVGDLADPGVSARHAQLVRAPDGRWELTDVGSTNGTTINDSTEPVAVDSAVEVARGDHLHVGAWTTIVIRSTQPGRPVGR